ncbi:hypothetical protein [Syntrophomonas erecta]
MTKRQKEKIIKMCRDGFGYSRISTTLGISENTVKSFCRRNLSSINVGPHVQKDGGHGGTRWTRGDGSIVSRCRHGRIWGQGEGCEGMSRKPRKKSETEIYHVIVRGIGQQDVFHEKDDFHRYWKP